MSVRAEDGVAIELSPAQVDHVVRAAGDAGNMTALMAGLAGVRDTLDASPRQLEDSRLSRSLLSGLMMLSALPPDGGYIGNAKLARTLNLNSSTAHRYLSTLLAVGLVERDPSTRKYRLAHLES